MVVLAAWLLATGLCEAAEPAPIGDLVARVVDGVVQVRWTTNVPARCRVEFGAELKQVAEEHAADLRGSTNAGNDSGVGFANNHRADLPLPDTWPLRFRVVGETGDGTPLRSEPATVPAPTPGREAVDRATVALHLDRGGWTVAEPPVTAGVPFPRGALYDPRHVRLVAGGQELTAQFQVVTRWASDGSVKWLRAGFEAVDGVDQVALEYGKAVNAATAAPMAARVDGAAGRVDAGELVLDLNADGTGSVAAGQRRLSLPVPVLVDEGGKVYTGRPEQAELEEQGPVRTVVHLAGPFRAADGATLFRYEMRLYAFAGKPWVRLDFTFENDRTDPDMSRFRSLRLAVDDFAAQPLKVGTDEQVELGDGEAVLQREDYQWLSLPGNRGGKRLQGVVEGDAARVLVRNFWEQYPVGVEHEGSRLWLGLYPELPGGYYADRPDENKFYYYLRDGFYTFRQGFEKTHTLWLDVSADAAARSLILDGPTATPEPAWTEASGAMRELGVAGKDRLPEFDALARAGAGHYLAQRDAAREYGLMNFGDWFGERGLNWGNLEYDLGHAMLMLYARTGDPSFYHRADEILRHEGDVDTRHYADDPRRVGQQWIHSMGHTAGYYPHGYKDMSGYASPGWSDNRGHVWAQGLFEHYLWGGDRRSFETAKLIADWAAGPQTTNFRFFNAREPGWMLLLVMGAYNATQDPFYLNAAKLMLREARRMSEATGGRGFHYHKLPNGHCDCPEDQKHYGEAGFMLGVQMTGMKMAYEVLGDERIADDIVGIARFIVETMYDPVRRGFRYTSCPKTGVTSSSTFILLEGLAFAANRSQDPALVQTVKDALLAAWGGFGEVGKSGGYVLCALPQGLAEAARLPGPSLADEEAKVRAWMASPARRPLPSLVPNPDFETDAEGWPSRPGIIALRTTDEAHSGQASLKLSGTCRGQNEYVNTRYDANADPFEICWLKPGERHRFTAWLKVVKLSPGTPAPTMRVQFRDASGSRSSAGTNAYDLARSGTWQKLTVDFDLPADNTRNYLALNTNSREEIEAELYLDDVSLVPVDRATGEDYGYVRLDPSAAASDGFGTTETPLGTWLTGAGRARWTAVVPREGRYVVWVKVAGAPGEVGRLSVAGTPLGAILGQDEPNWARVGQVQLQTGETEVSVELVSAQARLGRIVLTDDPSVP